MTVRTFAFVPLGVVLAWPGLAMAQKLTKKTVDVQDVPVPVRSPPQPQPSTPSAPRLTLDVFVGIKQARIQKIIDQQIAQLRSLIQLTNSDDPQMPDYLFRLGELFAEKYRYHESRARSLDEKIFRAEHDDASPAGPQRRDQKEQEQRAGQTLQKAIEQFMAAANYPSYARMDEVLFRMGYWLERSGHADKARPIFHRLLKEYPQSRYVPEALLSFADDFFAKGDMSRALDFYIKITQFPQSSVFGFALYKKAWSQANLGEYKAALTTFVDLIEQCQAGKIHQAQRVPLEKEARRDLVKTYARTPGADPDRAWEFFRHLGRNGSGNEAPGMLQALAELYWDEGMAAASSRVYRKVMTLEPQSPLLCAWQGKVLRNTLSAGTEPAQVQELRRLGTSYRHLQQLGHGKAVVIAECRDNYHDAARELAFVLHKQAQRLKQLPTFELAVDAYREFLSAFGDEPASTEAAFYYAECLWQTAALTGDSPTLWRETAEQYTRVIHRDPQGPHVKEAAYAAVLAWQNALYDTNEDLQGPSGTRPLSKQPGRASAAGFGHLVQLPVDIRYGAKEILL